MAGFHFRVGHRNLQTIVIREELIAVSQPWTSSGGESCVLPALSDLSCQGHLREGACGAPPEGAGGRAHRHGSGTCETRTRLRATLVLFKVGNQEHGTVQQPHRQRPLCADTPASGPAAAAAGTSEKEPLSL